MRPLSLKLLSRHGKALPIFTGVCQGGHAEEVNIAQSVYHYKAWIENAIRSLMPTTNRDLLSLNTTTS